MRKIFFCSVLSFISTVSFSQSPEDALLLSWYHVGGTARNQAIGGAMGSLGGDATANHINPAGLAFFKTSDFILTPGFQFGKGKSLFRGTQSTGESQNKAGLGTSGFVFGGFGYKGKNSFAITVTKLADFNKKTYYNGTNDYSSFGEPLADEFAFSNQTIDDALNNPSISLATKMALYTYLVDTASVNGNLQVISRSENTPIRNQQNISESKGGITELTLGAGTEFSKKLYAGISIGISYTNLERRTYFRESDASGDTNNDFSFLAYDEHYSLKGFGFNIKAGFIYRPKEFIRIGLAIHTPTWTPLRESVNSGFAADLENKFGQSNGYDSVASSVFTEFETLENRYVLSTPAKILISGSYVFREDANVQKQKGFITADIEYTNYKWLQYSAFDQSGTDAAFIPYNNAIDAIYKGAFNFRIGGELKFKTIMARLGFAYYGNPYNDDLLKARKMNISTGLGYRNKGMFLDLTYVHRLNKDVNFPYRVNAPRANTFADLKDNGGNVMLTLGFKI